ncbi:MAG TPA: helix-turn-helix domain-containing protein, partial [Actinomycetospora sp.]
NAGASRATVNRVLRAVAADGLLELRRGRIVVLDPAGLTRRGSAGF